MGADRSRDRALQLLRALGLRRFSFQAEAAARCIAAIRDRTRLLVEAPTGTGKTLIAHLTAALVAEELGDEFRGLALVPSRPLVRQHVLDGGWLLKRSLLPLHLLTPSDPAPMWSAVLEGPGLAYATPHSLRLRMDRLGGSRIVAGSSLVIFDEIDVYLTSDLEERRDIWPVVDACLSASVPVLGFTGTSLRAEERRAWEERGFELWRPNIPEGWLPFTTVDFIAVENDEVARADRELDERLLAAYRGFAAAGGNPRSWREIKQQAQLDGPLAAQARAILGLHGERLRLFEGEDDEGGKLRVLTEATRAGSALILCRYISSARAVAQFLRKEGRVVAQADGQMPAMAAQQAARSFREGEVDVLAITREVGGRGLDFPAADSAVLVSPRSNYQAVAQELARIRSRVEAPKRARVLYYAGTSETAKAARLAYHLVRNNRFADRRLFEVNGVPEPAWKLDPLELAHLPLEETIELDA